MHLEQRNSTVSVITLISNVFPINRKFSQWVIGNKLIDKLLSRVTADKADDLRLYRVQQRRQYLLKPTGPSLRFCALSRIAATRENFYHARVEIRDSVYGVNLVLRTTLCYVIDIEVIWPSFFDKLSESMKMCNFAPFLSFFLSFFLSVSLSSDKLRFLVKFSLYTIKKLRHPCASRNYTVIVIYKF